MVEVVQKKDWSFRQKSPFRFVKTGLRMMSRNIKCILEGNLIEIKRENKLKDGRETGPNCHIFNRNVNIDCKFSSKTDILTTYK